MFTGEWPDADVARLRKHWKASGKDVDAFEALVAKDSVLSKRTFGAIVIKARRMGLIKKGKNITKRFWYRNLSKARKAKFIRMAKSDKVSKSAIAKAFGKTETQIGQQIQRLGIRTNKYKVGAQEKKQRQQEAVGGPDTESMFDDTEKKLIKRILKLIKKDGRIRVATGATTLRQDKNAFRGFLKKLVESGILFDLTDPTDDTAYYYANRPGFYTPKKLIALIHNEEVDRIADHVDENPKSLDRLTAKIYGDRPNPPVHIVATILGRFEQHGLVKVDKHDYYSRTERGVEFGLDSMTLEFMDNAEVENRIVAQAEAEVPDAEKLTPDKLEKLAAKDLSEKRIRTVDMSGALAGRKRFKILPIAELLIGNQFADYPLLNYVMEHSRPDITVVSGLVQGAYSANQKNKQLVLSSKGGLNKVGHQLAAAGNVMKDLERITRDRLFYVSGDDDVMMAEDFAILAQKAEGKFWQHGVRGGTLSDEQNYRLAFRQFLVKRRIQMMVIQPYQIRIGRGLKNRREVYAATGVRKTEYRLIIEILALRQRRKPWPKVYEKVVNVKALFDNIGKRFVTPDNLSLMLPGKREMLCVHNTNFSPITQYVDPIFSMEQSIRQRLAARHTVPFITADFQQELFYFGYIGDEPRSGGHYFMTLPGMQNSLQEAEYRMKAPFRGALTSKSHRQNTFRKKLAIPGAAEWEFLDDGRIRLRLINNNIRKVLESQRDQPEVREGICFVTDTQHGSGTMVPEIEVKYMDYALYERKATRCYENGDILHGTNYPQHFAENRPWALTSMNSQKEFTLALQMPLIEHAPALREFGAWLGNHEWNSIGRHLSGTNDLEFLIAAVRSFRDGQIRAGKKPVLENVFNSSRIRLGRTHNPTNGDMVNWPYYATVIGGFKLAISHLWQLWGGGRTPIDKQRKWLTGLSRAAGDIDFMFGGHWHSLWGCQEAEKMLLQVPSTASQSGYEFVLGLMSTTMCTYIEVSNREGVVLEFVPWEFLHDHYRCKSPFYKGKDNQLLRPKKGTIDYKYSRMSPLIEHLIDEQTQHIDV